MEPFNLTTIAGWLTAINQLVSGALRLEPAAFQAALTQPGGQSVTMVLLFLAGLSATVGQSVILFANRVSRRRFAVSLVTFAAMLVFSVIVWVASIWLLANLLFDQQRPFNTVLIIVALCYAPLLYGFLVLLPYLGNILAVILRIWIFLATIAAVAAVYEFNLWAAAACCILGWLLLELASRLPLFRVARIRQWLWRLSTGRAQLHSPDELAEQYARRAGQQDNDRTG